MTRYRVTGTTPYRGHPPGEIFDADLDENAERRALERGSIKKTTAKTPEEKSELEEEVDDA